MSTDCFRLTSIFDGSFKQRAKCVVFWRAILGGEEARINVSDEDVPLESRMNNKDQKYV